MKALSSIIVSGIIGMSMITSASAAVIFSESFEEPANTLDWQVYQNFGNWAATSGAGIEIQQSGVAVNAHTGNQYVELDSDSIRGGTNNSSNSSMTTKLNLGAGTYLLTWYYQPRTDAKNDNIINVFLDGASDSIGTNLLTSVDGSQPATWTKITSSFSVDGSDNLYGLTFSADGDANTLGGFVDTVSLELTDRPVPVPEPSVIGLFGLGLVGLGVLRRRKARI